MPKLYSSDEVIKALERVGFTKVSQRGSHAKYRRIDAHGLGGLTAGDRRQQLLGQSHVELRTIGVGRGDQIHQLIRR